MIKLKMITLGAMALCISISGANGQGLVGERYVGFGIGYERISFPGDSLDGTSLGAEVNFPLSPPDAPVGFDANVGAGIARLTNDDFDVDAAAIGGLFRGFVPTGADITPYAGVGLTWSYAEVSGFGFSESDSSLEIPLEVGVEFVAGTFSLRPFYRYTLQTESDHDDYWSVGANASLWFSKKWGMTVNVTHSDLGDGWETLSVGAGALVSF